MKIKTSQPDWLNKVLKAHKDGKQYYIIDDANIGLSEKDLTSGINVISKAYTSEGVSLKNIIGALTGIGISGWGIYLIILAVKDPEPTSKLGLLILSGLSLALTGSLAALHALGLKFEVTKQGGEYKVRPVSN